MPLATWQVQVDTLLTGESTNYLLNADAGGIKGLGVPDAKNSDVELFHQDGSYPSDDFMSARVLTIPYLLVGTDVQVFTWLEDLKTAYRSNRSTDVDIIFGLPFYGDLTFTGRTRGLDADLSQAHFGIIECEGTFVAHDPNPS